MTTGLKRIVGGTLLLLSSASPALAATLTVPEPATDGLLSAGVLAALAWVHHRRKP